MQRAQKTATPPHAKGSENGHISTYKGLRKSHAKGSENGHTTTMTNKEANMAKKIHLPSFLPFFSFLFSLPSFFSPFSPPYFFPPPFSPLFPPFPPPLSLLSPNPSSARPTMLCIPLVIIMRSAWAVSNHGACAGAPPPLDRSEAELHS